MKTIFPRIVAALTVLALMLCAAPMNSSAAGEMAYNMYTSPDMSKTGKVHTTYMIDFRAPQSGYGTYWALANFGMDFSKETMKAFKGIKLGGIDLQNFKTVIYCLLIIVVINFRTQGIMGERELDIRSLRDYARKAQSKIKGGKKV